jgi:hypothetical protein
MFVCGVQRSRSDCVPRANASRGQVFRHACACERRRIGQRCREGRRCRTRETDIRVRRADAEWAICVVQAEAVRRRRAGGARCTRKCASLVRKAIHGAERQAGKVRAAELDRIVDTAGCQLVDVVDVKAVVTRDGLATVGIGATQIVSRERILTAERERADAILRQTDVRLTAEQRAALAQCTRARVEAVFQGENGLQAATEVFGTAQAPTTALRDAIAILDEIFPTGAAVVRVRDPRINQPVERHAALCVGDTGKAGQDSGGQYFLIQFILQLRTVANYPAIAAALRATGGIAIRVCETNVTVR